jgi:formate-dependent nitrite reductase membrane component NrfD
VNKTVRSQSRNNPPALPQGEVIAKFTNYAEAVAFVDGIIANGFPAGAVAIFGKDLRTVERVRGKMSYGRVAISGAVTGSWIGLFAGFVFGGSSATSAVTTTTSAFGSTFSTVLIGAGLGMLVNILRYSLMRNKRAFVSQSTVIASKYEVQVPSALADQASAAAAKSEG